MSARDLVIFLNRKLISCDTAVPLGLELKSVSPGSTVSFVSADASTAKAIRLNRVLHDAINTAGRLIEVGRHPDGARLRGRTGGLASLSGLLAKAATNRAALLHFKALNESPLSVFFKVAPRHTYMCQSDIFGFTKPMWDVTYGGGEQPPPVFKRPNASYLVAFNDYWPLIGSDPADGLPVFNFGPTRGRKSWIDYIRGNSERYFASEFESAGVTPSDKIFTVMLGTFQKLQYLRSPTSVEVRLEQLLRALVSVARGRPIVLKPHMITDMDRLRDVLSRIPDGNFMISYLHPMVLAQRSVCVAANYFSSTLGDASLVGVPTIEFTDYTDEALSATNGGSMRAEFVTHFINGDEAELARRLGALADGPLPTATVGSAGDESGFLAHLGGYLRGDALRH